MADPTSTLCELPESVRSSSHCSGLALSSWCTTESSALMSAGGFHLYNRRNHMPAKLLICLITLATMMVANPSLVHAARAANMGRELVAGFKYITNNALLDVEDIATSPLYVASPDSPLRAPKFIYDSTGRSTRIMGRLIRSCPNDAQSLEKHEHQ